MKSIPARDFAAVIDMERKLIIEAGNYSAMIDYDLKMNAAYQSEAYVAKRFYPEHPA